MEFSKRTIRDRDYSEILKKYGPLSNTDLCKKATEHPHFSKLASSAIEKDVDRFVKHYEYLGIVARNNGRIEWLPQAANVEGQSAKEATVEPTVPSTFESQHETVQKLLRGMANGSITLRDKSPHRELNRIKGKVYDEFMADIDLYNNYKNTPLISDLFETRIYNTALKLRAYGFIEEKEAPRSPDKGGE